MLTTLASAEVVILQNSCDYRWRKGCSPTSAGMVMGHYDRNGHDGLLYDEFMPGGVAESHTYYGSSTYIANDTIDDLAVYMDTNASGGTAFYYSPNGNSRMYVKDVYSWGPSYYNNSGMFGIYEFVDSCGYGSGNPSTDMNMFNQRIYGYGGYNNGFTFAGFMAEIDSGRPVMIHVKGHSMYAYGYDDSDETVYLHDTWRKGEHTMTWGGVYPHSSGDLQHYGVTVIHVTNGTPASAPPVALDDAYFVDEDVELSVAAAGVLTNDYDPNEDPLSAFQYTQPSHGTVSLGTDGSLQYTPETDYFGADSFTYRAYDGGDYSEPATVDITIAPINDAPVAVDDSYTVMRNGGLWEPAGVRVNDYDVDDGWYTTALLDQDVEHGSLDFYGNGRFLYVPDEDYYGLDYFTYYLDDGKDYSNVATATIMVLVLPGDANGDGTVDDADASILAAHWQMQSGATWADGDFNGDGKVDDRDASILAAHWLESLGESSAPVPEPSILAGLLGIALAGGIWLTQRRKEAKG
jgi:VCBS repeat-containing protein